MSNAPISQYAIPSTLDRVNYFPRQLITAADMFDEQSYFREKLRRHNRLLHGWGIVCGCVVSQKLKGSEKVKYTVEVSPGYVIDPLGNEIEIPCAVTYDLRGLPVDGVMPNGQGAWCGQPAASNPVYLAVCYDECETRPVRVAAAGCGCDASDCEYSRIRESFCLTAWSELPASYNEMTQERSSSYEPCKHTGVCPPQPDEACVILADIRVGSDGMLTPEPSDLHRRYVASYVDYYFTCGSTQNTLAPVVVAARDLGQYLDQSGMARLRKVHGGAVGAAVMLPLTALGQLGAGSDVGKALQAVTIGDAAALTLEKFKQEAEKLLADIEPGKRRYFDRLAESIWAKACEVEHLTREFRATDLA